MDTFFGNNILIFSSLAVAVCSIIFLLLRKNFEEKKALNHSIAIDEYRASPKQKICGISAFNDGFEVFFVKEMNEKQVLVLFCEQTYVNLQLAMKALNRGFSLIQKIPEKSRRGIYLEMDDFLDGDFLLIKPMEEEK